MKCYMLKQATNMENEFNMQGNNTIYAITKGNSTVQQKDIN